MSTPSLLDLLKSLPPANPAKAERHSRGKASQSFAAQGQVPANTLSVDVEGFGALGAPMALERAAELSRLSSPARFGKREATLLDAAVRHTGEIGADAVHVRWTPGTLAALQADIAQALGVERLEMRLHNLLVYGPGQFFKPHQDTEKQPGMVATLVLVWPCAHIGGELRVRLGNEERRLASQQLQGGSAIRWFAFYADCRHEVLPLEEGWRVALTMDLVLPKATQPVPEASVPPGLTAALGQHFRLEGEPRLTPWVLLLDHEYSQHGLGWHLLKGADRARVGALRAAAQALGLTLHLALAEVHETWTALIDDRYSRSRRQGAADEPEPDELVEESLVLDFWVDAQGQVSSQASLSVSPDDVDSLIDTGEQHLVDSEYEGYMGNYGETLDYWYRRAALVIQSPLAAERTRFMIDFDAALASLHALAGRSGSGPALAARVKAGRQALAGKITSQGRTLLQRYADIAAALPGDDEARDLLTPFSPTSFTGQDATALAHLEKSRGTAWMQALLKSWTDPEPPHRAWASSTVVPIFFSASDRPTEPQLWPAAFAEVMQACREAGVSDAWLAAWLQACVQALARFDEKLARSMPATQMALQDTHLKTVCELVTAIRCVPGCDKLLHGVLEHVVGLNDIYPPKTLAALVGAAAQAANKAPARQSLRELVTHSLQAALAEPLRAADDHSLCGVRWICRCSDCAPVVRWAESPDGEPLVLAMAEGRRGHVQTQLQHAGAPLAAETLKQGSPYKLKLTKPGGLLKQNETQRQRWSRDLEQLRQSAA